MLQYLRSGAAARWAGAPPAAAAVGTHRPLRRGVVLAARDKAAGLQAVAVQQLGRWCLQSGAHTEDLTC
jgi:hypothetical protein